MSKTSSLPNILTTAHGEIRFPAYVPVTTFGGKYPLDDLVRPYLPRLAPAVMVSMYYAKQMKEHPRLPLLIDSGGFASLFKNVVVKSKHGLGVMEYCSEDQVEVTHPKDVLDFQEQHADVGFTLDFPIPPTMKGSERAQRLKLTIANAHWALANRRRHDLKLFACIQGWDTESYQICAETYATSGFDGVAIGGLVPRLHNKEMLFSIIEVVRSTVPNLPLHVFGVGQPHIVKQLYARGVQSVDSSSYVKMAADGKLWGHTKSVMTDISPMDRLHLALCNLATATQSTMPLSSTAMVFRTHGLGLSHSAENR